MRDGAKWLKYEQPQGTPKAKREGKYKGRKPTAREKKAEVLELLERGHSKREIARLVGISERSVFRVVGTK